MEGRSGGEVCRRLFRLVMKEQLPWMSGPAVTPKCRFSSGSRGKSTLPWSTDGSIWRASRGGDSMWGRIGLSTRGADLVMVRRVESLGGVRGMVTEKPGGRASSHGIRNALPTTDEERHTDEYLKRAKEEQAAKIMKVEKEVGGVAGQSLAATDAELVQKLGRNDADVQKDIAEEMIKRSELGKAGNDGSPSESEAHLDPNGEHPEVDEEVKRGLVADSAFPMGRTEKKADEDEEHVGLENKVDVSEHGSFKSHL